MSKARVATLPQLYPLTPQELECFGWEDRIGVMACRSPDGKRSIPTRTILADGEFFYGSVETMEPPDSISEEDWEVVFGSWDTIYPGYLN